MRCPQCDGTRNRVVDTRTSRGGRAVRRRRECTGCGDRFTTYEKAELSLPRIVKRDGSRVPFSEEKLRSGMLRALEKRPVPSDRLEAAVSHIKRQLMGREVVVAVTE